jgi:plastocyanin
MSKRKKGRSRPAPVAADAAANEGEQLGEEERAARRAQQKADWAAEKKRAQRKPMPVSTWAWIGVGIGGVALIALIVYLVTSSGSGSDTVAAPSATPDGRVAGLPIAKTEEVEADDDGQATNARFNPTTVTGNAGEVIEIKMINVGSVAHNLRVAGVDQEYDTADDFLTEPGTIKAGEEGSALVKIDDPGSYPFRCDFHPEQQTGILVLN